MPASSVGAEIKQLTRRGPSRGPRKGKKYSRRQAIAAAMNMARQGAFGEKMKRKARKHRRTRGR